MTISTPKTYPNRPNGYLLIMALLVATVLVMLSSVLLNFAIRQHKLGQTEHKSVSNLEVSEAGINYYLWHLSHNPTDYTDGTGSPGPYVHEYKDVSGNVLGTYSLEIEPPQPGGTIVTVTSTGQVAGDNRERVVRSQLGVPSFARYAFVINAEVWFGDTETTNGPVHSNSGIHFDGVASGPVTAAVESYVPTYPFGGDGKSHPGIWGTGGPQEFWHFPVPPVDYTAITADLSEIKQKASANGVNRGNGLWVGDGIYLSYSNTFGYHVRFNSNQTLDIYRVTQRTATVGGRQTYGISRETQIANDIAMPGNSLIFVEDNLWVDGQINNSKVTVGSGRFPDTPSTNTTIYLNKNLLYTYKDGTDVIGLIAQKDIIVGYYSENYLEIDAALLAQKGQAYRPYYPNNIKERIEIYGAVASYSWWTWSYVNQWNQIVSGYRNTVHTYDENLTFGPPPSFPTTGAYTILSWEEL